MRGRDAVERAVAAIALLIGLAALVVALAWRGGRFPRDDAASLERRLAGIEQQLAEIRGQIESLREGAASSTNGKPEAAREVAEWPVVARELARALELDPGQTDIVDAALAECDRAADAALEHDSPLWRDRLSKRARKAAYEKVAACLRPDQRRRFHAWLVDPSNDYLACWFQPDRPCGGCGKRKTAKSVTGKRH
jgi:hypothetical protein